MATYKILYWQDIPTQIKVEDDAGDEVSVELDPKFMLLVDEVAMKRGLKGADDFLDQWKWSDEEDREGSAKQVAEALKAELEADPRW